MTRIYYSYSRLYIDITNKYKIHKEETMENVGIVETVNVTETPLSKVQQLRPMDDTFFTKLAEDVNFCQELLQVVLEKPDLRVISTQPQKVLRNIEARSVTVDVLCEDAAHNRYNIEIQKEDNDDHQRRVRYNGSNVDTYIAEKGTKFNELPDLYVVYISSFDTFNGGRTIYHINRVVQETGEVVNNGYHEVYVNTKVDDGTTIADLMQIFKSNTVPSDIRFPETCRVIRYFKEGKGRDEMCEIIEEYAKKKALDAVEQHNKDIARKCVRRGDTDSEIMEITTLTLEEIKRIREEELQLA